MPIFELPDEAATATFAARIAALARPGDVIALKGELGAGKTSFARAFIRARGGRDEDVPSPTFTLAQAYDFPDATVWHFDCYRLRHPDEAWELAIEDATVGRNRPKLDRYTTHDFLTSYAVMLDSSSGQLETHEVSAFVTHNALITVRPDEGFSLIEWPERLGQLLPARRLEITLLPDAAPEARRAAVDAGPDWAARLAALAAEA